MNFPNAIKKAVDTSVNNPLWRWSSYMPNMDNARPTFLGNYQAWPFWARDSLALPSENHLYVVPDYPRGDYASWFVYLCLIIRGPISSIHSELFGVSESNLSPINSFCNSETTYLLKKWWWFWVLYPCQKSDYFQFQTQIQRTRPFHISISALKPLK